MDGAVKKRVLVVDDDHEFAHAVSVYFRLQGVDVVTAGDGASAIEATQTLSPDAIVLDLQMPHLGGLEFCQLLRRGLSDSDTPVIVLTGLSAGVWRQDLLEAGANECLTKPCDFSELYSRVSSFMD